MPLAAGCSAGGRGNVMRHQGDWWALLPNLPHLPGQTPRLEAEGICRSALASVPWGKGQAAGQSGVAGCGGKARSRVWTVTCLPAPPVVRTGSHTGCAQSWSAAGAELPGAPTSCRALALPGGCGTAAAAPAPGWGKGAGYGTGSDAAARLQSTAHLPALLGTTLLSPVLRCATLLVVQTQVTTCLQQKQHHQATA